jgi:hypothetical protein
MRQLVKLLPGENIYDALRRSFTGGNQSSGDLVIEESESRFITLPGNLEDRFDIGYRQIWLYAMRHYREMPTTHKRGNKDLLAKPDLEQDQAVLYEFAAFANRLGFESNEISALQRRSADWEIAQNALLKARKPSRYEYREDLLQSYISQIMEMFRTANPLNLVPETPLYTCDNPDASGNRCGFPTIAAEEQNRPFLFLNNLHKAPLEGGQNITSFFVRRSVYLSFFGNIATNISTNADTILQHQARVAQERLNQEEQDRLKQLEQNRLKRLEQERLNQEEQDRLKRLEQDRLKRLEQERLNQEEQDRLKRLEQERVNQEEQDRLKRLEQDRLKRLEQNRLKRLEQERLNQEEQDRLKQLEQDRLKRLEQERVNQEEQDRPDTDASSPGTQFVIDDIVEGYTDDQIRSQRSSPEPTPTHTNFSKQTETHIRILIRIDKEKDIWRETRGLTFDASDPKTVERIVIKYQRKGYRAVDKNSNLLIPRMCLDVVMASPTRALRLIPENELEINQQTGTSISLNQELRNIEVNQQTEACISPNQELRRLKPFFVDNLEEEL